MQSDTDVRRIAEDVARIKIEACKETSAARAKGVTEQLAGLREDIRALTSSINGSGQSKGLKDRLTVCEERLETLQAKDSKFGDRLWTLVLIAGSGLLGYFFRK